MLPKVSVAPMRLAFSATLTFALGCTALTAHAAPPPSLAFEFDDARLLGGSASKSAWLHVARATTSANSTTGTTGATSTTKDAPPAKREATEMPLVVFLHGLSFFPQKYVWMGGGRTDLRRVADKLAARTGPFVLAAPTQLKDAASAKTLWADFDLAAFVDATARAAADVGITIDRSRVILVGHSGAGCNPEGGIFASASRDDDMPRAILAIDTCLDEDIGRAAARTQRVVWMTWQEVEWPRDPNGTMRGFLEDTDAELVENLHMEKIAVPGTDAHNGIVPLAFERVLPDLLKL